MPRKPATIGALSAVIERKASGVYDTTTCSSAAPSPGTTVALIHCPVRNATSAIPIPMPSIASVIRPTVVSGSSSMSYLLFTEGPH